MFAYILPWITPLHRKWFHTAQPICRHTLLLPFYAPLRSSSLLSSAVLCLWLALNCKICAIFNFIKLLRAVFCLCCFTLVENPPRTLNYDYRKHIHTPTYTQTHIHCGTHIHTHGGFAECSGQTRPRTQVQLIKFCAIYFAQNFTNNNKATTTQQQQYNNNINSKLLFTFHFVVLHLQNSFPYGERKSLCLCSK